MYSTTMYKMWQPDVKNII